MRLALALSVVLALSAPAASADTTVELAAAPCSPESAEVSWTSGGSTVHAHANRTVAGACVGAGVDIRSVRTCPSPLDGLVGEPLPCLPCAPVCFHGATATSLRAQRL